MNTSHRSIVAAALAAALCVSGAAAWGEATVAVFNFQMKSDTPEWRWLEKFFADQITTDITHDRTVSVIARDEMQVVAQKMRWVPEMAADARGMGQVRKELKIQQLVSGVYGVQDGQLEVTAQVVEVGTRKECHRAQLTGKTDDVLALQKRLSADLLSWFTKRPADRILAMLPVWTRSIPAARALYEGMDLYDQGRYPEAWLNFRRSGRCDAAYLEARYWVAKMYYFMDRYAHARLAYEEFAYRDSTHPRMGDAAREFLHTFEKLDAPGEVLLRLYAHFRKRFPDLDMHEPAMSDSDMPSAEWFDIRSGKVLQGLGRHKEAAQMARAAMPSPGRMRSRGATTMTNVILYHLLTGEAPEVDLLMAESEYPRIRWRAGQYFLAFADGATEALTRPAPEPVRILGRNQKGLDARAIFSSHHVSWSALLLARPGHVFERVQFFPDADGADGVFEVQAYHPEDLRQPLLPAAAKGLKEARGEGIGFDNLAPTGMLPVRFDVRVSDSQAGRPILVTGVRVVPRFRKVGPFGAVRVTCPETCDVRVAVDGRPARLYTGLVGLLPPGKHVLKLTPLDEGSPLQAASADVEIQQGKTVDLAVHLPWKEGTPWGAWAGAPLADGRYPGHLLALREYRSTPCVLAEEGGIRLVWDYQRDVWTSFSADGKTFSPPHRVPLPVSSGWIERDVRCVRDESGRYLLVFKSNRDARHRSRLYACWSRDLEHFSAPALIIDQGLAGYDLVYDRRGRYVLLAWISASGPARYSVYVSADGFGWQKAPGGFALPNKLGWIPDQRIRQSSDGTYVAWATECRPTRTAIYRTESTDLQRWSRPEIVGDLEGDFQCLSPVEGGGRTYVVLFGAARYWRNGVTAVLGRDAQGAWRRSETFPCVGFHDGSAAYHPRWGYTMAWLTRESTEGSFRARSGPFVLRGNSLEPMLQHAQIAATPPEPQQKPPAKPPAKRLPPPAIGELRHVPVGDKRWPLIERRPYLHVSGESNFRAAGSGAGTVSPKAVVADVKGHSFACKLAFDAAKPGTDLPRVSIVTIHGPGMPAPEDRKDSDALPRVVRWDLTNKGDFSQAVTIPLTNVSSTSGGPPSCTFEKPGLMVRLGDTDVPVDFVCDYAIGSRGPYVDLLLAACCEGRCRFGQAVHAVRVFDQSNNLRFTDVAKAVVYEGRVTGFEPADVVVVDLEDRRFRRRTSFGLYGHPICVDGKLWNVTITDDLKISAEPYQGATGLVKIDHPVWSCWFIGRRRIMALSGGPEPLPLPEDAYLPARYKEYTSTQASRTELWLGNLYPSVSDRGRLDVAPGKTATLRIGSPLGGRMTARPSGGQVVFEVEFTDVTGLPLWQLLLPDRSMPPEPFVDITDAAGKPIGRIKLKYTGRFWRKGVWEKPPGASGRLTAVLKAQAGGFAVEVPDVTFTAE